MSEHKKNNPGYVTKPFCDERHSRTEALFEEKFKNAFSKLDSIEDKVDGLKTEIGARSWKPRDYAVIVVSVVALAGTIIAAIL